jgi:hypothetical protein
MVANQSNYECMKKRMREIDFNNRRALAKERLVQKEHKTKTRAFFQNRILDIIENEVMAADLLMTLFISALHCYRKTSICEPFPEEFVLENDERNYEDVELYCNALPGLGNLKKQNSLSNLPLKALQLVSFILDTQYHDELILTQIPLEQYKIETAGIDSKQSEGSNPNYIIKIEYTDQHHVNKTFTKVKNQYGSIMGFHGSPLENFHSILRNGLDHTYGKETSLFGDGIYLSSDRDVAFSFLKPGPNCYSHSIFGPRMGCIVCAEVACKPKVVRRSNEQSSLTGITIESDNSLPKGYIVSEENECVQAKYILIYNNFLAPTSSKNKVCILMAFLYVLFLVALWLMKSMPIKRFLLHGTYS